MIKVYPYDTLGKADFGWLQATYHFSFARYHNPDRMGFGALRVINDDIVAAGRGFAPHPHNDMEIITFVKEGAISHKDSEGNAGRTEAGNVQVMSAGSGIEHAEHNAEKTETKLFQIWIEPKEKGIKPRWDMATFSDRVANDALPLLVSGRAEDQGKEGVLYIHQESSIYGGLIKENKTIQHHIKDQAYVLVSFGRIEINGQLVQQGDGVEITDEEIMTIKAIEDSEVIIIDTP